MWYSLTRSAEIIHIENLFSNSIELEVIFDIDCNNSETKTFTIDPTHTFSYSMQKDGEYTFKVIKDKGLQTEESISSYVSFYDNFLKRIILTLEELYCGCSDCDDCDDCDKDNILLESYYKVLTYYTLTKKYYATYLDAMLPCIRCEIMNEVHCLTNSEKYLGNYDNKNFLKKTIAYYYISFYLAEVESNNEVEIKEKFKYDTIINCIKDFNIENCIKNRTMGLFTINSAAYINQPPTQVGDYSLSVANRSTTTLTSAMFTTDTTPAYSDPEGDLADAIKIDDLTGLVDGELQYDTGAGWSIVGVGDIITIADIDLGKLRYVSPVQDAADTDTFEFSVRDEGSNTFYPVP